MLARVFVGLAALCTSACISYSRTGSGDFDLTERTNAAISEVLEASKTTEDALIKRAGGQLDDETTVLIARHFAEADRLTKAHAAKVLSGDMDSWLPPGDIRQRRIILRRSMELSPSYVVIDSPSVEAIAFPTGRIFLSKPLANGFNTSITGFDPILLGILVHELTHVRGGHAMEQWATSAGRRAWMMDTVLNAVTSVTKFLPFLSIERRIEHSSNYAASPSLSKLSEYVADLAAVALLVEAGHDGNKYIDFIGSLHDSAGGSEKGMLSSLGTRRRCLEILRATKFSFDASHIIIGGDMNAVHVIPLKSIEAIAGDLDKPEALAVHFKDQAKQTRSTAQLREEALEAVRRTMYFACAVVNSLPVKRLDDGILQTPFFDTSLFTDYL